MERMIRIHIRTRTRTRTRTGNPPIPAFRIMWGPLSPSACGLAVAITDITVVIITAAIGAGILADGEEGTAERASVTNGAQQTA
jgi:hypothetical protein